MRFYVCEEGTSWLERARRMSRIRGANRGADLTEVHRDGKVWLVPRASLTGRDLAAIGARVARRRRLAPTHGPTLYALGFFTSLLAGLAFIIADPTRAVWLGPTSSLIVIINALASVGTLLFLSGSLSGLGRVQPGVQ
jgi:hypothetical protein